MIDITQTQGQNSFKGLGTGGKGLPVSFSGSNTQGSRVMFPVDQVVQSDASASTPISAQKNMIEQPQRIDIFVVSDSVFSLYKLPNGELFSKVRNLKTGEETTFPNLDSFSFFEAMRGTRGMFFEQEI